MMMLCDRENLSLHQLMVIQFWSVLGLDVYGLKVLHGEQFQILSE